MSVKLMAKAWEAEIGGTELLVLLSLADFANDEGECFPSLDTIAKKAKVSRSALKYVLKTFENLKVIEREKRYRDNGSQTSTRYRILRLNITKEEYQKAYQKARGYAKKEGGGHNVAGGSHDVATPKNNKNEQIVAGGEATQCGLLEPSYRTKEKKEKNILKKEKKESGKKFSFSLPSNRSFENLSEEYKEKLEGFAIQADQGWCFEDFISYHVAKGSKFKNWAMAYRTWLSNSIKFGGTNKTPNAVKSQNGETVYLDWTGTKVSLPDYRVRKVLKVVNNADKTEENIPEMPKTQSRDINSILSKALGGRK